MFGLFIIYILFVYFFTHTHVRDTKQLPLLILYYYLLYDITYPYPILPYNIIVLPITRLRFLRQRRLLCVSIDRLPRPPPPPPCRYNF